MPAFFPIAGGAIADVQTTALLPATSLPIFPSLPGLAWPIQRTPLWQSRKPVAYSGKETAISDFVYPRYLWTLVHDVLRQGQINGIAGYVEETTLFNFFDEMGGGFSAFLYADQDDHAATNQLLGLGTGSAIYFPFLRSFGGFVEPVQAIKLTSPAPVIKINGITQSASTYTITQPGTTHPQGPGWLIFNSPPGNGLAVTATFSFYWVCRFLSDRCSFENFLSGYWRCKSLSFASFLT